MDLRLGNFLCPLMARTMVAGIRETVLLKIGKVFKRGVFFIGDVGGGLGYNGG